VSEGSSSGGMPAASGCLRPRTLRAFLGSQRRRSGAPSQRESSSHRASAVNTGFGRRTSGDGLTAGELRASRSRLGGLGVATAAVPAQWIVCVRSRQSSEHRD
jgi:hypothetical protein